MWNNKGKQGKKVKDKVSIIKRFLSGEDIVSEIVPLYHGLAVLNADELNKLRLIQQYGVEPIEGMSITHDGVEIDFREWAAIQDKVKNAFVVLPDNLRDHRP